MISLSEVTMQEDETLLVSLSGCIDESEVKQAQILFATFIETKSSLVKTIHVDLAELGTVSSYVVAFLLSGLRQAKKYGCTLCYINLPKYLFNMAKVGGVDAILLGEA